MIASFFDGRVRLQRDELKDPATMELVMGLIRSRDGVRDLVPNSRTGSLVVTYDPEIVPREALLEAAATLEKQLGTGKGSPKKRVTRKKCSDSPLSPFAETGLLAGLYALTVLTGFVSKRAHIAGAVLFTGLTALHVYNRRKHIYPR